MLVFNRLLMCRMYFKNRTAWCSDKLLRLEDPRGGPLSADHHKVGSATPVWGLRESTLLLLLFTEWLMISKPCDAYCMVLISAWILHYWHFLYYFIHVRWCEPGILLLLKRLRYGSVLLNPGTNQPEFCKAVHLTVLRYLYNYSYTKRHLVSPSVVVGRCYPALHSVIRTLISSGTAA